MSRGGNRSGKSRPDDQIQLVRHALINGKGVAPGFDGRSGTQRQCLTPGRDPRAIGSQQSEHIVPARKPGCELKVSSS